MKIQWLNYFLSVAKNLSFTKAAHECHIAQPALSKQIKQLEEEVDIILFNRASKKISLTDAGEVFYKYIFELMEYYELSLKNVHNIFRYPDHFSIGISSFADSELLADAIDKMQRAVPNIIIEYKTVCASNPMRWLNEQQCDIVFTWSDIDSISDGITTDIIIDRNFEILLSHKNSLCKKDEILKNDIKSQTLIIPSCPYCDSFTKFYLHKLKCIGITYDKYLIAKDRESMYFMLESNMGISIVPENIFINHSSGICNRHIKECCKFGQWKSMYISTNENVFIKILVNMLSKS